jgi:hypothetical protein
MNKKLYQMAVKKVPKKAYMHDWWLYMTASCFGKVIYDKKPYVRYRQHGSNAVGSAVKYGELFRKRIENFNALRTYVPSQVKEFTEIFELPEEKKKLAELMLAEHGDYGKRIRLLSCRKIARRKRWDTVLYKVGYLFW